MTIGRGMSTQMATPTSTMSTTVPTDYFSPGTDWNDCCYYVKSFGILFPRYGNSVEDDPDNSYGSPVTIWDDFACLVDPSGGLGDGVIDDYYSIVVRSYGSPDMDWGGNAYCVNPSGYVDFYNDGNIFDSYGR